MPSHSKSLIADQITANNVRPLPDYRGVPSKLFRWCDFDFHDRVPNSSKPIEARRELLASVDLCLGSRDDLGKAGWACAKVFDIWSPSQGDSASEWCGDVPMPVSEARYLLSTAFVDEGPNICFDSLCSRFGDIHELRPINVVPEDVLLRIERDTTALEKLSLRHWGKRLKDRYESQMQQLDEEYQLNLSNIERRLNLINEQLRELRRGSKREAEPDIAARIDARTKERKELRDDILDLEVRDSESRLRSAQNTALNLFKPSVCTLFTLRWRVKY